MANLTMKDKEILVAFASNGMSISRTAFATAMHRKTITYHLNSVRRKTGHDPYDFYALIHLLRVECLGDKDDS